MKKRKQLSIVNYKHLIFVALAVFLVSGCGALSNPPRLATATALAALSPTETPEPILLAAPTQTINNQQSTNNEQQPIIDIQANPVLTVWVNETSAEHEATLDEMMVQFSELNNIDVELKLVSPSLLPELVKTAVLSYTLPDIIIHPLEQSVGWAEEGIFDANVTSQIIDQIGRDSFNPDALALITTENGIAAIPSDGFQQLLIYRADWVDEQGLSAPTNYADMLTFAEASFDLENNQTTGFVIPTESNLVTTHQAFEQLAAANGCELIDANGEVTILDPTCQDALNFYFNIVHQFSPPGVQTDTSVRNAYLAGRTSMIMSSPTILPQLAGLGGNELPSCPNCVNNPAYLAQNSGFTTKVMGNRLIGNGLIENEQIQSANFGNMTLLGITTEAQMETAVLFAQFWFNEGYERWLAVESERKVPMRWGTAVMPNQFIDVWGTKPLSGTDFSLMDIYGETAVNQLRDGIASSKRWGIQQGQGRLMADIYQELTLSIVLQEMLSGYFNPSKTIIETYNRIIELIPNYPYEIDPATLANDN